MKKLNNWFVVKVFCTDFKDNFYYKIGIMQEILLNNEILLSDALTEDQADLKCEEISKLENIPVFDNNIDTVID